MRSEKELYQIVLDNPGNIYGICTGISCCTIFGKITLEEELLLLEHFKKQKPTIFSKFWWNKAYKGKGYWWTLDEKGFEQRRKFLQYLIDKKC